MKSTRRTLRALVPPSVPAQRPAHSEPRRERSTPATTYRSSYPPPTGPDSAAGSLRPAPIKAITGPYSSMGGSADVVAVPVTSREYCYRLVDVFAEEPFSGNPLAVFTDASGLDNAAMQRIARELNRSQTSFVFPQEPGTAGPRVRVFTPRAELTGLRHPSIGTAFAMEYEKQLASGGSCPCGRVVLQSTDGAISVSVFARVMTVRQAVPRLGPACDDVEAVVAMLGLTNDDCIQNKPVRVGSSGVPYLLVPLRTREALGRICFRRDIWERTARHWEAPKILAFTTAAERPGSTCRLRVFAPDVGVPEEAATETACGPLAAYLIEYGLVPAEPSQVFVLEQGAEIERPSYMHVVVEREGTKITSVRVGGQCVSVGSGTLCVAVAASS